MTTTDSPGRSAWLGRVASAGVMVLAASCGGTDGSGTDAIVVAARRTSHLTFSVAASSGITGETFTTLQGSVDPGRGVASLSRPGHSVPDFLFVGDSHYERTELSGLTAPTPWVVYTPEESGAAFRRWVRELLEEGLDCGELFERLTITTSGEGLLSQALSGLDPLTLFDDLRELTASADRIGGEDVRGVPTTHYRVEFDEERFADRQRAVAKRDTADLPAGAQRCLGSWYPTGPPPHVDVWIDGAERVRRFEQWQPLEIGPSPDARFLTRIEFFDFGVDVDVTPPAREDVTPAGILRYPRSEPGSVDGNAPVARTGREPL